ncbi:MAG: hypoxanthine phosphoribosyltransferase [Acidimicrobiia bacterium]|nr:hypoxanthine phosphoribosyltransferase [Acidimicrobiia bacterium]
MPRPDPSSGVPVPALVLGPDELHATVARLGRELSATHSDDTIFVGVLKGSLLFMSDLARAVDFLPLIDFLAVSPYPSGGGRVRLVKDLSLDVEGSDVVLVEDVIDTGLSLTFLRAELQRRGPRSVTVCALVDKPARRLVAVEVDHVGISVAADYVIGYGLDFAGRYRNLDLLAAADPRVLATDPDRYVEWAYSRTPHP